MREFRRRSTVSCDLDVRAAKQPGRCSPGLSKLKQALKQEHPQLFVQIPRQVWSIDWVADVPAVGRGEPALKYLAAYVYRTAFSAKRILSDDGQFITFSYRHRDSGDTRTVRLPGEAFLHRFLQHGLPRGFQRVRSFGWLSAAAKTKWQRILALLDWNQPQLTPPTPSPAPLCPCCHILMQLTVIFCSFHSGRALSSAKS